MGKLKRYDLYEGDDEFISPSLPGKQPLGRDENLRERDAYDRRHNREEWPMLAPVRYQVLTGTRHFLTAVNFLTAGAATPMRRDSRSKRARLKNSAGAFCNPQKTRAIPAR